MELETREEYFQALDIINELDLKINKAYSYLNRETREEFIVALQDYIDQAQNKRTGLFNLVIYYEIKNNSTTTEETYTCMTGDTLPLVAQAFYHSHSAWQFIYFYNDLEDVNLEVHQELKILKINDEHEEVLGAGLIQFIEQGF